jgi:hypothetical protein
MKRLVSLGLCLSLSIFTMARAMKPSRTLAVVAKGTPNAATERNADAETLLDDSNKPFAQAEEQEGAADEDTGGEVTSDDDDAMEDASDNEGVDVSDDDSGDDEGADDNSGDDDSGNDDGGGNGGD